MSVRLRARLVTPAPPPEPPPDPVAPVVANRSFTIDTGYGLGDPVGTLTVANPLEAPGPYTWAITGGNEAGAFALDAETGAITVLDPEELLDGEGPAGPFSLAYTAENTVGVSNEATATVTVEMQGAVTDIAEVQVVNRSATDSLYAVSFGHVFKAGDVPASSALVVRLGDVEQAATFPRRNSRDDGSLRRADITVRLSTPVPPEETVTLQIGARVDDWDDALPAAQTVDDIVADAVANFNEPTVLIEGMTDHLDGEVGSGEFHWDGWAALQGERTVTGSGPNLLELRTRGMLLDTDDESEHPTLEVVGYFRLHLDPADGSVEDVEYKVAISQPFIADVLHRRYEYTAKLFLGATLIRSWGYADDDRLKVQAASSIGTGNSLIAIDGANGFLSEDIVKLEQATLPAVTHAGRAVFAKRIDADHFKLYWGYNAALSEIGAAGGGWNGVKWRSLDTEASYSFTTGSTQRVFSGADVDTATGVITLEAHGIPGSLTVNTTTSGTVQTLSGDAPVLGLDTDNLLWVRRESGNIRLYFEQEVLGKNNATFSFADQGSGDVTIRRKVLTHAWCGWFLHDAECAWDSIERPQRYAVDHDSAYLTESGVIPPYNVSDFAGTAETDPTPTLYTQGGSRMRHPVMRFDEGGQTGTEANALLPNWDVMRLRYPQDHDGWVRTSRVMAHSYIHTRMLRRVRETGRIPHCHPNRTYAGLGAGYPNSWMYNWDNRSTDMTPGFARGAATSISCTGGDAGYAGPDNYSHHPSYTFMAYMLDGGQPLLDLQLVEGINAFWTRTNAIRNQTVGATTHIVLLGNAEVRSCGWRLGALAQVLASAPDGSDEKQFFWDALFASDGTFAWWAARIAGFSESWHTAGLWDDTSASNADSNNEFLTTFMQGFVHHGAGFLQMVQPSAGGLAFCQHVVQFHKALTESANCGKFAASYRVGVRQFNPSGQSRATDVYRPPNDLEYYNRRGGTLASRTIQLASDGTCTLAANSNNAGIEVLEGDRIRPTRTHIENLNRNGGTAWPSPFVEGTIYYVRQVAMDGLSFKLSTDNSDDNIVAETTAASNLFCGYLVGGRETGCPTRGQDDISSCRGFGYTMIHLFAAAMFHRLGLTDGSSFDLLDAIRQASPDTASNAFQQGLKWCGKKVA